MTDSLRDRYEDAACTDNVWFAAIASVALIVAGLLIGRLS
jgi:hypothetical protein